MSDIDQHSWCTDTYRLYIEEISKYANEQGHKGNVTQPLLTSISRIILNPMKGL